MSLRLIEEGNQEPIFGRFLALSHRWWQSAGPEVTGRSAAVPARGARLANLTQLRH